MGLYSGEIEADGFLCLGFIIVHRFMWLSSTSEYILRMTVTFRCRKIVHSMCLSTQPYINTPKESCPQTLYKAACVCRWRNLHL